MSSNKGERYATTGNPTTYPTLYNLGCSFMNDLDV